MAYPVNLPSGASRHTEVGLVWVQEFAGSTGTFEQVVRGSVRIHAITGPVTVTIGGVVSLTIEAGETEIFNVGTGASEDGKTPVTVIVAGGTSNVSISREKETGRRTK